MKFWFSGTAMRSVHRKFVVNVMFFERLSGEVLFMHANCLQVQLIENNSLNRLRQIVRCMEMGERAFVFKNCAPCH